MLFNQLKTGDRVHILEVLGTFKKSTVYNTGIVSQVSAPYDEPLPQGQFPLPGQTRRKLVDIYVTCDGESKKLAVPQEKSIIIDSTIGLTVATDKTEIANMVRSNYNEYKAKKEAVLKYDEEMENCKKILDQLEVQIKPDEQEVKYNDTKEIDQMKSDIMEIKDMIANVKKMFPFAQQSIPNVPQITALTKVD